MSTTWDQRIALAQRWESEVANRLRALGWTCESFGQGLLPNETRTMLRRHAHAQHRWLPDLLAARNDDIVLIDAKTVIDVKPCHAVEKASLSALVEHERTALMPLYIVFHDWGVARACELWKLTDDKTVCREGPLSSNGSGTPYWLFKKHKMPRTFNGTFA